MAVTKPISHSDPRVSVIIPTIPSNELTALSALEIQTEDKFEVIVVSDASIDRCEARNKGIEAANAEIIAQTDDDCLPPANWVCRIKEYFQENPKMVLLEGTLDKQRLPERHYIGGNLAYRREKALEVGGFNSEFPVWRDDTEFGWRMEIEHGIDRCYYDNTLEVVHDGPLRTNIDWELERKLRLRYPHRYYKTIWKTDIPFNSVIAAAIANVYQVSPSVGEQIFKIGYKIHSS